MRCSFSSLSLSLVLLIASHPGRFGVEGGLSSPGGVPASVLLLNTSTCAPVFDSCLTAGFELYYDASGA